MTFTLPILGALAFAVRAEPPVEPDAEEARRWLLDELSNAPYHEAQPSWFDQLATALWDWLNSLSISGNGGLQGVGLVVVLLLIAAVIVAAFFIFGPPALARRSAVVGELFGENDERDATAMRVEAEGFARAENWAAAIADMFRAIARGLAERTIVTTTPGTTAHTFATTAGEAFPTHAPELATSADAFDGVRYLGRPGTREGYEQIAWLERALRASSPQLVHDAVLPRDTTGLDS